MVRKTATLFRLLAATLAIAIAAVATPAVAAKRPNIWKVWVEDLGDRETKIEVPFLVIISIAPMIAITPIWLGQLAYDAAKGKD